MSKTAATKYVLALDQGTTSSRAILFGHDGRSMATAQQEFPQILPAPGIVEHDPEAIWNSQLAVAREAIKKADIGQRSDSPPSVSPISAKPRSLGARQRPAGGQRHCLAKPRECAHLRAAQSRWPGAN